MEIMPFTKEDIPSLAALQPPGWNSIQEVFQQFVDFPFFEAYKMESNGELIAVGEMISHPESAWIGNIITRESHRKRGIGTRMTRHLCSLLESRKIPHVFLLATPLGKPLYQKLGFRVTSEYHFFRHPNGPLRRESPASSVEIRPLTPGDWKSVFELDQMATGEKRSHMLPFFFQAGLVAVYENKVTGFYLPDLGDGLIVSANPEAGMNLFFSRLQNKSYFILPEENLNVIQWAHAMGFEKYRMAYRMIKGPDIPWQPSWIFNRIGGYLG